LDAITSARVSCLTWPLHLSPPLLFGKQTVATHRKRIVGRVKPRAAAINLGVALTISAVQLDARRTAATALNRHVTATCTSKPGSRINIQTPRASHATRWRFNILLVPGQGCALVLGSGRVNIEVRKCGRQLERSTWRRQRRNGDISGPSRSGAVFGSHSAVRLRPMAWCARVNTRRAKSS